MSIFSDDEFEFECARINREDRADREQLYFKPDDDMDMDDVEGE